MSNAADEPEVEVRRSRRRRRTVSAYREGERIVVLIPASMSKSEESRWVTDMVARLRRQEGRRRRSDEDLLVRAHQLNDLYFGGLAAPASVRWVSNQKQRWGSCTPGDRSIRLSDRLHAVPDWVVDYVLVHELAHLLEPGHSPEFWGWVERYPKSERARGFLEGYSAAARLEPPDAEGSADTEA